MTSDLVLPKWYWIAVIVALLWNLIGVSAFFMQMFISPEMLADMTEAQRTALDDNPTWYTAAYGTSVIAGALGCSAMMLRSSWAILLFIISLAAILLQTFYAFFLSEHMPDFGPGEVIMPIMIVVIGILLIWFARSSRDKGWIY